MNKKDDRSMQMLAVFRKLLRGRKQYKTTYMYQQAGKSFFIESKTAGDVIRNYYKESIITAEMRAFCIDNNEQNADLFLIRFAKQIKGLDLNESKYIIRIIKSKKQQQNEESNR